MFRHYTCKRGRVIPSLARVGNDRMENDYKRITITPNDLVEDVLLTIGLVRWVPSVQHLSDEIATKGAMP